MILFEVKKIRKYLMIAVASSVIFAGSANISFGQYKGAPVKKDRLIKALRSKQLQTEDIVTVINSNGVDFELTAEIRNALVAAGARPEVVRAVANNPRLNSGKNVKRPSALDYDDLLEQALFSFREKKNSKDAVKYLQTAVKMRPRDAKAYQMLGFVNLYGLNNLVEAEKYMREAVSHGGSAVFRVYHDDKGSFTQKCTGSLYVSSARIRFESDNNVHTFETSIINVDKVLLDRESSKVWNDYPIFKVFLKLGKSETRFRFAPLDGSPAEPQMALRMIDEAKSNRFLAKF